MDRYPTYTAPLYNRWNWILPLNTTLTLTLSLTGALNLNLTLILKLTLILTIKFKTGGVQADILRLWNHLKPCQEV